MKEILKALILFYQKTLSFWLGGHCRFYPTCSHYALEAIEKKGTRKGLQLTVIRIFKCHPFHPGGFDPIEHGTKV